MPIFRLDGDKLIIAQETNLNLKNIWRIGLKIARGQLLITQVATYLT